MIFGSSNLCLDFKASLKFNLILGPYGPSRLLHYIYALRYCVNRQMHFIFGPPSALPFYGRTLDIARCRIQSWKTFFSYTFSSMGFYKFTLLKLSLLTQSRESSILKKPGSRTGSLVDQFLCITHTCTWIHDEYIGAPRLFIFMR